MTAILNDFVGLTFQRSGLGAVLVFADDPLGNVDAAGQIDGASRMDVACPQPHPCDATQLFDLAVIHTLKHVHGTPANDHVADLWVRRTACFRRIDGVWLACGPLRRGDEARLVAERPPPTARAFQRLERSSAAATCRIIHQNRGQELMNDIDFRDSLRRTFLVWSWVGILGALVATATSYSSQLYFTLSQGFRALDLRPNSSFMFTVYLLPSTCLILDWIIFYRYSGILYSVIILDVPGSDANQEAESRKTWHQLFVQFKYTLLYLILTWLLIMAVNSLPVLLALR